MPTGVQSMWIHSEQESHCTQTLSSPASMSSANVPVHPIHIASPSSDASTSTDTISSASTSLDLFFDFLSLLSFVPSNKIFLSPSFLFLQVASPCQAPLVLESEYNPWKSSCREVHQGFVLVSAYLQQLMEMTVLRRDAAKSLLN